MRYCFHAWWKICYDMHAGINRTALREIKLLQELHHPNIIGVSYYIVKQVDIMFIVVVRCLWPQI